MKYQQYGLWVLIFGSVCLLSSALQVLSNTQNCNKGPSIWCENIQNAKKCNAVQHCIQTVWEQQDFPEDKGSICQICLDMVKQARDQLESNETQNDLKAIFEGSCRLIPIKQIQKECIKISDDFIPELVEALASQMNPQIVCSVAGLCNNAKIDKMLEEYKPTPTTTIAPIEKSDQYKRRILSCNECERVAEVISTKFKISDRDDMLDSVLGLCGHASSFSDACGNIALTYFSDFFNYLNENINANGICHMSGTCSVKYHNHPENIEVRSRSEIGVVVVNNDIPCELCQQLVHHLQEVLIANTTEIEFKMVLEGLCKQTNGFKIECLSIVDQYYDKIYQALVKDLDANGACFLIGICPKGNTNRFLAQGDLKPLIPYVQPAKIDIKIKRLHVGGLPVYTKEQINAMQLPIDRILGPKNPELLVQNGQLCTLCEYFLHFLQEDLANPATEASIKNVVNRVCDKFASALRGSCHNFVDMYGDAIIALIIQSFNPREICPKLQMCPKNTKKIEMDVFALEPKDILINAKDDQSDKPTCPLCLFAVQQAQELIKDNKSKKNIRNVLDNLCSHLPNKLKTECVDFVDTYSNELIDMLITDFTPQQICVYIKLCPSDNFVEWANIGVDNSDEDQSNEKTSGPECVFCEKVISEAEKKLGPKKSKQQIKNALHHACDKLHKGKNKCHKYIDKYGDKIAELILEQISAKQICQELGYCLLIDDESILNEMYDQINMERNTFETSRISDKASNSDDTKDPPPCVLCEFVIAKLEVELKDKKTQEEIKHEVETICKKMPNTVSENCEQFVEKYGNLIISLLETLPPKQICQKLQLCLALNNKVKDQVVECGVCHGATSNLVQYTKEQGEMSFDLQTMIEVACDNLPAKYYKKCAELLKYYGESILNMNKFKTDQSEICAEIGKCFKEENPGLAYIKMEENFNRVRRNDVILGANKCTYGPAHWCASRENAKSCGSTEFCEKKIWKDTSSN